MTQTFGEILQIKAAVRKRDGYRCVLCHMTNDQHKIMRKAQLQVHRIIPGSLYSAEPGVCETLCHFCHQHMPKKPHWRNYRKKNGEVRRVWVELGGDAAAVERYRQERIASREVIAKNRAAAALALAQPAITLRIPLNPYRAVCGA